MPQLPTYNAQATPNVGPVGYTGQQVVNVTEGLTRGAMSLTRDLSEQKFQIENVVSEEASNKFKEFQLKKTAWLKSLEGGDAIKPSQETGLTPAEQMIEDLKKYKETLKGTLGGGAQRLFEVKTQPFMLHAEQQGLEHTASQTRVFRVGQGQGTYALAKQSVESAPKDEEVYKQAQRDALMSIELEHPGLSPEAKAAITAEKMSGVFYSRVMAAAKDNPFYAKELLDKNPGVLVGQQKLHAQDVVENEYLGAQADKLLDDIDGPVDQQLRKPETTVLREITKAAGGNQHLKERMQLNYHQRKGALTSDDDTTAKNLGGLVAGISARNGYAAALNSSQLQLMLTNPSPHVQAAGAAMKEHIIAQMRSNETHEREKPMTPVQQAALFKAMEDPTISTWSDTALQSLQPKIGLKGVLTLQTYAHEVRTTPQKAVQLKEDKDQLVTELSVAINPATQKPFLTGKEKPSEREAILAPFQYRLKQLQELQNKPWSLEESRKNIKLLTSGVEAGTTTWHLFSPSTSDQIPFVEALSRPMPEATLNAIRSAYKLTPAGRLPGAQLSTIEIQNTFGVLKRKGLVDENGNLIPGKSTVLSIDGAK